MSADQGAVPGAPGEGAAADAAAGAFLEAHGIPYRRYEHPPVFTCEEADHLVPAEAAGIQTKNLFVRDKRGRRHWLIVTSCAKPIDLRRTARVLGADTLSLGSPERLRTYLGVTPGAVTLLALTHPGAGDVELVIDREIWTGEALRCHPMVNTATLVIARDDARRFVEATGHSIALVDLPRAGDGGAAEPGG